MPGAGSCTQSRSQQAGLCGDPDPMAAFPRYRLHVSRGRATGGGYYWLRNASTGSTAAAFSAGIKAASVALASSTAVAAASTQG